MGLLNNLCQDTTAILNGVLTSTGDILSVLESETVLPQKPRAKTRTLRSPPYFAFPQMPQRQQVCPSL